VRSKWIRTHIGDSKYTRLILGQSPDSESYNKDRRGLPFYQGKVDFGIVSPTPTVWCDKPKKIALPNDILLCVRAPVGPTNIADEQCCIGRGLAAIRCLEGLDYRYMVLVMKLFERDIAAKGRGSTFDAIGRDEIMKIEFQFPERVEEQITVAQELQSRLAHAESLRQRTVSQLEAIEALPAAILREAFDFGKDEEK
jgi:type I restriction enzyme, S subunit